MRATVDTRIKTSLAKTGPLRQERFVIMSELHRIHHVCTSVCKHVSDPSNIYTDYKCVGDNREKFLVTKRKDIFINSRQGA